MRDKRPIDELSVEELERVLAIRRREERQNRMRRMQDSGRTVSVPSSANNLTVAQNLSDLPAQHERAAAVPAPIEPSGYDLTQDVPHFDDDIVEETPVYVSNTPSFIESEAPPLEIERKPRTKTNGEKTTQQKLLSWGLLALEIVFIGGLAIILYRGFVGLEDIQTNTNLTQAELDRLIQQGRIQPSPTPILSAANHLISGGHSPPDENGNSQFNLLEVERYVPENLRPAVHRELLSAPVGIFEERPTNPISLDIPALNINNASIVNGDSWEALKAGVGYRTNSGTPGSDQNVVLVGHNDIYGEIFRYLPELQIGDEIRIRDASGRVHTYAVSESQRVQPDAVWVMDPNLGAQVTLITCYPYQVDDERWIVFADLVE